MAGRMNGFIAVLLFFARLYAQSPGLLQSTSRSGISAEFVRGYSVLPHHSYFGLMTMVYVNAGGHADGARVGLNWGSPMPSRQG